MGYILYTPSRSLIGGSDGKLHPDLQAYMPRHEDKVTQKESLDGSNVETTYNGRVQFYDVKSDPIDFANWDKWEEFGHSVAGGETFTLDAFGTEGVPDNAISVKMKPKSWKVEEIGPRHHVFSFVVRVI